MDGDVVAQFSEITGSNTELATQYLQLTDFNIEQAMQLYFENGGAPLTEAPRQPTTATSQRPTVTSGAGYEDESGVVHVDSDDDVAVDEARSSAARRAHADMAAPSGIEEDDAVMARRLQEELFAGGDSHDTVRAPMARTTETLVGPDADLEDEVMHTGIFSQLRARQSRNSASSLELHISIDCYC